MLFIKIELKFAKKLALTAAEAENFESDDENENFDSGNKVENSESGTKAENS